MEYGEFYQPKKIYKYCNKTEFTKETLPFYLKQELEDLKLNDNITIQKTIDLINMIFIVEQLKRP